MKGSVAIRRASPPHLGPHLGPSHHHRHHHFPPMAVDSLHHHHANNHNSHQHMARVKAGVARTTSSSSAASSSSALSSSSAQDRLHANHTSSASSSGGGTGGRASDPRSDRLGGSGTGSGSGTSTSSERLTPRRFMDKYSLPRVVRVVSEPCSSSSRQPLSGPLAQPLLLYRQYTSCKVLARSLRRDKHAATETGPPLVIPDSYQGWFSLVRERSLQTRAKVYTTIQQLVSARVAVFLSKNPLTGFKLAHSPSPDGEMSGLSGLAGRRLQYARSSIRGGQVLRLLAVFEDNESGCSSARSRRGPGGPGGLGGGGRGAGLGRSLMGGSQPTQYAQCLTARNESVFVPVSATGSFYAVATEDGVDADRDADEVDVDVDVDVDLSRVYQLPQLLRLTAEPLPVKVQLVCGPIQSPLPNGFSGLLVLEDLQQEDVILACTLPRSWALPSTGNPTPSPPGHTPTPTPTPTPNPAASGASSANGDAAISSANNTVTTSSSSSSSSATPSPDDCSVKPVFLEMDADSKFLLMRPLASREAEARFFKTPLLRRVLAHCRDRADLWSSQIKVTHHVFPAVAADSATASANPVTPANATSASAATSVTSAGAAGSARPPSEHGAGGRVIHGLFRGRDRDKDKEGSALGGKASSLSSGGTKKSQSFRYASPAMMGGSTSGSTGTGGGGKPPSGAASTSPSAAPSVSSARGTHRGTHQLLQQLQSLPGLKNLLRRSSSITPQSPQAQVPDVPLSVVFPELFGLPPAASKVGSGSGSNVTEEMEGAGGANGGGVIDGGGGGGGGGGVTVITTTPVSASSAPARPQQLRFYADDLPYGRVADALPLPAVSKPPPRAPRPRTTAPRAARGNSPRRRPKGRPLYDEAEEVDDGDEDEDDDEDDDVQNRRRHNDDDEENIYAEICECPRRGRGVVVSGARVILTTACSEERRGYYTFASATSKDQYYTGGSDGTFSGTMSSSNPSNPEEDIYDNVC